MRELTGVGLVVFALPFGVFGVIQLVSMGTLAISGPAWAAGGRLWVAGAGLVLVGACVAIISRRRVVTGALTLAGVIGGCIVLIYLPGLLDPARMRLSLVSLLKDTSLLGAALMVAGRFGRPRSPTATPPSGE